jgi:hypothetical protein
MISPKENTIAPNARRPVWVYSRNAKIVAGGFALMLPCAAGYEGTRSDGKRT